MRQRGSLDVDQHISCTQDCFECLRGAEPVDDPTFPSQGLSCAAWYYVPAGLKAGETRPVVVTAHGFLGASEGEPRQRIFWYEQIGEVVFAQRRPRGASDQSVMESQI